MTIARMSLKTRLVFFPLTGAIIMALAVYRTLVRRLVAEPIPLTLAAGLRLLAADLAAGATGGLLVALAFPLTRWLGGALVVGALGVFPGLLVFVLFDENPGPWRATLLFASIGALIIGGLVGSGFWMGEKRRSYRLAHVWLFAAVCSAVAWIVGLQWAGQWPAAVAMVVFLLPVGFALMITFARRDNRESSQPAGDRAA